MSSDPEHKPVNLEDYACSVCGNSPDDEGIIEHGRGCYVVSENGGGISYVDISSLDKHKSRIE
jgi:hypothetical protein